MNNTRPRGFHSVAIRANHPALPHRVRAKSFRSRARTVGSDRAGTILAGLLLLVWLAGRAGAVVIIDPPYGQMATPGENIKFTVAAEGHPPIFYQWRLNGHPLTGETNAELLLFNVQATNGGAFSVTVEDLDDAITTDFAVLRVLAATGPAPQDVFANRPTVMDFAGLLQGDSTAAQSEPGEPLMSGGGKTVWVRWVAPGNGIATFTTRGSAFDTLLGVFTGNTVSNLAVVAHDDDLGGFYTSTVRFNAQRDFAYEIMLDGFDYAGIGGEFTLSWNLEVTSDTIPVFLTPPRTMSVLAGSNALFGIEVIPSDQTYQWFFNGVEIPGATSQNLTVLQPTVAHVGRYHVRATKASGRNADSPPADLQLAFGDAAPIDNNYRAVMQDKYQNLPESSANGNRGGAGYISIGIGNTYSKNTYSSTNGQVGDPTPCGGGFSGTLWQGILATNNGVIQVDTINSAIPARLAVYFGAPGFPGTTQIVCDVTSCLTKQPCVVKFNAAAGTNYTVVVEGYHTNGILEFTAKMGAAPSVVLPSPAPTCLVATGGVFILDAPANNWCPPPAFQWQHSGTNLPNATNASLVLMNFSAAHAGSYHIVLSNFVTVKTNRSSTLLLQGPFLLSGSFLTNAGPKRFKIAASNAAPFILQSSSMVDGGWQSVATNLDPCSILLFTNANAALDAARYFRAIPWPPPP